MRLRPVHPAAAADFLADAVETGPSEAGLRQVRRLAGPQEHDSAEMARAVARARHLGLTVIRLPMPMAGLRSGLLPHDDDDVDVDARRFSDWLAES